MVLWHTEVEGQSPAEVGQLLDMNPNAVAALAYRAREGLRQAYLTEHTPRSAGTSKDCQTTTGRLGAYVRGGLTPARETKVRAHLDRCEDCQRAYLELASVNTSMPALVVFAVLGPIGGSYLAAAGGATALTAPFVAAITPIAQGGGSVAAAAAAGALGAGAGGIAASSGSGAGAAGGLGRPRRAQPLHRGRRRRGRRRPGRHRRASPRPATTPPTPP